MLLQESKVQDLMVRTAKDFMIAKIKLARVVNNGDFHEALDAKLPSSLHVIEGVPLFCKMDLRGYEAPLIIGVEYKTKGDLKVYAGQKISEPTKDQNESCYRQVRYPSCLLVL